MEVSFTQRKQTAAITAVFIMGCCSSSTSQHGSSSLHKLFQHCLREREGFSPRQSSKAAHKDMDSTPEVGKCENSV